MPLSFRYSGLDTAHRCLYKYKRIYVDKAEFDGLGTGDTHFGTAMHAGLEATLTGSSSEQVFEIYWDSIKDQKLAYSRFGWAPLKSMGLRLLDRFERLHKKNFEPFMLEQQMSGTIGKHTVTGTVDYLGLYKGLPSVLDFKTSNRTYEKEKIIIGEQMPIYYELARQAHKYEAKQLVYFVFVKSEDKIQTLTLPVKRGWMHDRLTNVRLMCDELATRESFPRNPNSCMMGSFKCPLFNECYGGTKDE